MSRWCRGWTNEPLTEYIYMEIRSFKIHCLNSYGTRNNIFESKRGLFCPNEVTIINIQGSTGRHRILRIH